MSIIIDEKTQTIKELHCRCGLSFPMINTIPDLTYPPVLDKADDHARTFYDARVDPYDVYLPLTFKTHNENEWEVRNKLIDLLQIDKGQRVLDLACGTGRDSILIAERLGSAGQLFMQDISPNMLQSCIKKMAEYDLTKKYCIANGVYLPFPDNFFDAVYSFGGLGEFSDIGKSLAEMARVTKIGGKVVVGDESIPPWLRGTEFAKILITTNPQFTAEVPLESLPVQARQVRVQWIIGGVFYVIDFQVGEGEPTANFDFEISGPRGGTYRTRYEGQLEGVSREAKELYFQAAEQCGVSRYAWLNRIVTEAALRDLKNKNTGGN